MEARKFLSKWIRWYIRKHKFLYFIIFFEFWNFIKINYGSIIPYFVLVYIASLPDDVKMLRMRFNMLYKKLITDWVRVCTAI